MYIPVITAPAESDARRRETTALVDRMCFELRETREEPQAAPRTQNLLPLFLRAVSRTGRRPEYLSAPAETTVFGAEPEHGETRLSARG